MKARKPLNVFFSVVRALFLRELDMRISVGKSGLFWTFLEPFFQIFIFIVLRMAIQSNTEYDSGTNFEYAVFMASGFIAFNMFKNILSSSTGAFVANRGLFVYKQVKPIDTIVSRMLVELFLVSIIVFIFLHYQYSF